jgi:hypothetical protein
LIKKSPPKKADESHQQQPMVAVMMQELPMPMAQPSMG